MAAHSRRNSVSWRWPREATSWPPIQTSPEVGSMSLRRQRMKVDLPLPDSPITTKNSPRSSVMETFLTAVTAPFSSAWATEAGSLVSTRTPLAAKTFHRLLTRRTGWFMAVSLMSSSLPEVGRLPPRSLQRFEDAGGHFGLEPLGPEVLVLAQEPDGGLLGARGLQLHVGQGRVGELEGRLVVRKELDEVGVLSGEVGVGRDAHGHGREGAAVVAVLAPALLGERRLLEQGHVENAHYPGRLPVVAEPGLAPVVGALDGGVERGLRARVEDLVELVQSVRLHSKDVVSGDLPARDAVVEAALVGALGVLEELPVLTHVGHRSEVGGHGLDAAFGVALDHVGGHVPTLRGVGEVGPEVDDGALFDGLVPDGLDVVDPGFHRNVDVAAAHPQEARLRVGEDVVDVVAEAVLGNEAGYAIMDESAVPAPVGEHHVLS